MIEDFLPNKVLADKQSSLMRTFLSTSLLEILDYSSDFLDQKTVKNCREKIELLIGSNKISGFLYAINLQLIKAIKDNNKESISLWFNYINSTNLSCDFNKIILLNEVQDPHKQNLLINTNAIENIDLEREFRDHSQISCETVKKNIDNAFKLVQKVDDSFYNEIQLFIKEILISKKMPPVQGSSTDIFGAIYFNYEVISSNVIDAFERLTHECAHLYLYTIYFEDDLIKNDPSEKYFHALRKDPRPLISVYHACFVLGRMVFLLHKLIEKVQKKDIILFFHDNVHAEALFFKYKQDLEKSIQELDKHAQYTKQGEALIKSIRKMLTNINN